MSPASDDPVLTIPQAARRLGVSRQTLWRMHAVYRLLDPPLRLSPGRVGYRRSTLDAYLDQVAESVS